MLLAQTLQLSVLITFSLASLSNVPNVLELTNENFHDKIQEYSEILVKFHSPSCSYCKEFNKLYESLGEELFHNDSNVRLAQVDCTVNVECCELYEVTKYPTLKVFKRGVESMIFDRTRTRENLLQFLDDEFSPGLIRVSSKEEIDAIITRGTFVVVGYFKAYSGYQWVFESVARRMKKEITFVLYAPEEIDDNDYIELFRPNYLSNQFEDDSVVYNGKPLTVHELENFIRSNKHGLVGYRTSENVRDFTLPLFVLFYNINFTLHKKQTLYTRNRVLQISKKYPEYSFAISSLSYLPKLLYYNNTDNNSAVFVAVREKFVMEDTFTIENCEKFLAQYKINALKPVIQSEPIHDNSNAVVKTAVGANFQELVLDNKHDVLVVFVSHTCYYCKLLEPTLEELGTLLTEDAVDIVKINAARNDIPSKFDIDSYPTIVWISSTAKDTMEYYFETDRSLETLLEFISKRVSVPLKHGPKTTITNIETNIKDEL